MKTKQRKEEVNSKQTPQNRKQNETINRLNAFLPSVSALLSFSLRYSFFSRIKTCTTKALSSRGASDRRSLHLSVLLCGDLLCAPETHRRLHESRKLFSPLPDVPRHQYANRFPGTVLFSLTERDDGDDDDDDDA